MSTKTISMSLSEYEADIKNASDKGVVRGRGEMLEQLEKALLYGQPMEFPDTPGLNGGQFRAQRLNDILKERGKK
jgi:hypothetical protein